MRTKVFNSIFNKRKKDVSTPHENSVGDSKAELKNIILTFFAYVICNKISHKMFFFV